MQMAARRVLIVLSTPESVWAGRSQAACVCTITIEFPLGMYLGNLVGYTLQRLMNAYHVYFAGSLSVRSFFNGVQEGAYSLCT